VLGESPLRYEIADEIAPWSLRRAWFSLTLNGMADTRLPTDPPVVMLIITHVSFRLRGSVVRAAHARPRVAGSWDGGSVF
jgi:hypothetical protein